MLVTMMRVPVLALGSLSAIRRQRLDCLECGCSQGSTLLLCTRQLILEPENLLVQVRYLLVGGEQLVLLSVQIAEVSSEQAVRRDLLEPLDVLTQPRLDLADLGDALVLDAHHSPLVLHCALQLV